MQRTTAFTCRVGCKERDVSENRDAGPVKFICWFGSDILNVPGFVSSRLFFSLVRPRLLFEELLYDWGILPELLDGSECLLGPGVCIKVFQVRSLVGQVHLHGPI